MSILKEVMASAIMLNMKQKGILAAIFSAATPELAFEATSGTEALMVQRDQLAKLGFINVGMGMVNFTPFGQRALVTNNIVGEDGKLTPDGNMYYEKVKNNKALNKPDEEEVKKESVDFTLLRSLSEGSGK